MNVKYFILCWFLIFTGLFSAPIASSAQVLPPAIQAQLDAQNMTEAEARQMAAQLGINLNDPIQAAQRARELGVPGATIQQLLRAVRDADTADQPADNLSTPADTLDIPIATLQEIQEQFETAVAQRDLVEAQDVEDDSLSYFPSYFGYSLFENIPDAFAPNPVGPVDDGYLVGPGDELFLSVWGAAEFQYTLPVDLEGRIFVQHVGQITVAGKRLNALREDLKRTLSRSYSGLVSDPPAVFMDLTVTRLRPIHIFVLGEVGRPGGYTVSSSSTLFNVLYSVGGPLTRGSLRSIDVIRNGRIIETLDVSDYLLKGFSGRPIRLQSNDFVFVRPRGKSVLISGQVNRPVTFELTEDEDFADLLEYAGGLLPDAYSKRFQIQRIIPIDERTDPSIARRVIDLNLEAVLSDQEVVKLQDGDIVTIFSISDRVENAITITGEVFQPGRYELTGDLATVRDLIERADGLTEIAYLDQATLVRLNEDFTERHISLDLHRVLDDDPAHNIVLKQRDQITIFSREDIQPVGQVSISGQVLNPQTIPFRDDMTLSDLLFAGGGLMDSLFVQTVLLDRADLFRKMPDSPNATIIPFHLGDAIGGKGSALLMLHPNDEVFIYARNTVQVAGETLEISGAVNAPGTFAYRENLTLEDIILQAGGFTPYAYLKTAEVTRGVYAEANLARTISVPLLGDAWTGGTVSEDVLSRMFAARNFRLEPMDHVYIRTDPNNRPEETVSVTGEVRFPGTYVIEHENETVNSVIRRAGGLLNTAYAIGGSLSRGGLEVIMDFHGALNGSVRDNVSVLPGDQIFFPRKPNTVSVSGNVYRPGLIKFREGKRANYYLDMAGGVAPETEDIYVKGGNGSVHKIRKGLFRSNPRVDDGSVITVTLKPPKTAENRIDIGEIITETISVLATALTAIILATKL